MRLAFVGGGVMAEAIIGGVVRSGVAKADEITVGEPVAPRRDYLAQH